MLFLLNVLIFSSKDPTGFNGRLSVELFNGRLRVNIDLKIRELIRNLWTCNFLAINLTSHDNDHDNLQC